MLSKLVSLALASSLLLASASAQLWENTRTTAAQPILSGFKGAGDTLKKGGATIELDRVGQRVVGVYVTAPKSDTDAVARAILSGWGAPESAIPDLKKVLANPGFQAEASKGVFQEVDSSGQSEVSIRLLNGRWQAYNAIKVFPASAFPEASEPLGQAGAPARIDIVSDYQCPYCKRLWDSAAMQSWRGKPGVYRLSYHHFPLSMHPNAMPAAAYAECAAEQGKMWAFSDLVFARFDEWARASDADARNKFANFARETGVSGDLSNCVRGQESEVRQGSAQLQRNLQVRGTPSVYVNGVKVMNYGDPREVREIRAVTEGAQAAASIIEWRLQRLR